MTAESQRAYWVEQLNGLLDGVTLQGDRQRPPVPSFVRATISHTPGASLYDQVRQCASDCATTPLVVLLAALNAVLHRYTGATDIPLGVVLDAGPRGNQGNLVVLRTHLSEERADELIHQLAATVEAAAANSEYPLRSIREALAQTNGGTEPPLFQIAVAFASRADHLEPGFGSNGYAAEFAEEFARCDLVLHVCEESGALVWACDYDAELFEAATLERFLQHLEILLAGLANGQAGPVATLPLLPAAELRQLLHEWNNTAREFPRHTCIHQAFEARVAQAPEAVAVIFQHQQLTYSQLNSRANQLAHGLRGLGVGPDTLVGICVDRSIEMLVGLLGILKAGAAYVPLDPSYPPDRLAFMLEDAQVRLLLTQRRLLDVLPQSTATVICLDSAPSQFQAEPVENPASNGTSDNLAYVIYTSGSTGRPKGVLVTHLNVANFFTGMDQHLGGEEPGVWLAVTSISFDISVLELFWTLTRGFTVVLYADELAPGTRDSMPSAAHQNRIDFSLLYFASGADQDAGNRYRLLLEGAKFADQHGFEAVWTPERHFHAFGGLYPNPAVTGAAVAAVTDRIRIRAGSVVLPLQNPIRVAEEWSVVDNLSRGRVAISFASGWQINDFVLAPAHYASRKEVMMREIETVRRLWRGETLSFPGVDGKPVPVKIWPPPVQAELPIWLTATGNPETCQAAGHLGANLLTHLIGQDLDDLADKIRLYRAAWRERGHPGEGRVTLMLHTFVGENPESVRQTVREPFGDYLRTSVDLLKHSPWGFAPARLPPRAQVQKRSTAPTELSPDELAGLLEHAFEQYYRTSSLFGTPEQCLRTVERLQGVGVDEIACLIDFGVDSQAVLDSLGLLNEVRERSRQNRSGAAPDHSLAALARRHGVTHFQCTASLAALLVDQPENEAWMKRLRKLLIGGEAFPATLAHRLRQWVPAGLHNMYGPTETTVWSTTEAVAEVNGSVPIGRPMANTQVYLLDRHLQPVPCGVAGELCIGGVGVVRGYLHRPELTAEKFIPNPFDANLGSRLYRTGDLARYRRDGSLEFLGRLDHQVKIRGHRVELAEIESVLGRHPSVRECVVIARQTASGDQRVVAYVVSQGSGRPAAKLLRDFLQTELPEFMAPGAYVFLDHLPRTPNHKIDRRALPAPEVESDADAAQFVAPRTPVEEVVAGIWAELLGADRVSVEANFFELGGHSLLAMHLTTRLREVFRIELPLGVFFRTPTVAGLSEFLTTHEPSRGLVEKTALLMKRVEGMSEGEIARQLEAGHVR